MTERTIRVLIAKPGLDGHDRGAKIIARALRDAGMEVIYTGLRQTPEMVAEAALQEDVDVVGLSILSGAHMALVPRIMELLAENGMDDVRVIIGGVIPDEDIETLTQIGVSGIFSPGANTDEIVAHIRAAVMGVLMDIASLAQQALDGERRAIARAISVVEHGAADAAEMLAAIYPHTGGAHRIGITGPPGTGKSTLVNALALAMRKRDFSIAIVAVDPTSPFSGGAVLGDRIRMRDLSGDPNVFIRSMATRGRLGGLAATTSDVVEVLDAAGFDFVLIETVGAGQAEVDIARAAHTTVVVEAPGLGDDVQAIKAGILEIADLLVVNKADHPLADSAFRALRAMLDLGTSRAASAGHHGPHNINDNQEQALPESGWDVSLLKTIATQQEGIEELLETILAHKKHLRTSGELVLRDRSRIETHLQNLLRESLYNQLLERVGKR